MEDFKNEDSKKDIGFILSLAALLVFSLMGAGIDTDEFLQRKELNIPDDYFYLIFGVDLLMILGLILIFFYRKVGVFLFPVAVLTHYMLHNYYLSTFLYTDVTNLFLFISVGLVAFIPKWKFFK
ncbi:MAG: hypothetical protein ACOH1X_00085 [Kaistella sp.]